MLRTDSGAAVVVTEYRWASSEELLLAGGLGWGGGQSVGVRREVGSEREAGGGGARAAAEPGSLRQAGTQWPHYHTGWQGLRRRGRKKEKNHKRTRRPSLLDRGER